MYIRLQYNYNIFLLPFLHPNSALVVLCLSSLQNSLYLTDVILCIYCSICIMLLVFEQREDEALVIVFGKQLPT